MSVLGLKLLMGFCCSSDANYRMDAMVLHWRRILIVLIMAC